MFENFTYEKLMEDVLNSAPSDIDKRQGSIFYDAVSGVVLKIAKLYTDIELISQITTVASASGEFLDIKAREYGVTRLSATKAKYRALFEGVTADLGERFFTDGNYFTLKNDGAAFFFEAETAGESQNNIYSGTPAIPVNTIDGLISAKFGMIYENGSDRENDDNFRKRIQEKIAGPAENGNIQHYKSWCESIDGVGKAKIIPLWNGPNTVKAVLADTTGKPLGASKVREVQQFIDPADKGMSTVLDGKIYTIGDGLGNGKANIGAHFTACAANPFEISVTFSAELANAGDKESVEKEVFDAVENYFKELVLNENTEIIVRLSAIGAMLSNLKSLIDYSDLKLNGNTHNITISGDDVPVLSEVRIE